MSKILLIEDDIELSSLLAKLLHLEGFDTHCAHNGEQGLSLALNDEFDLILLDVMLPKLNGFELLKELRQHQQTPVLILTAKGDEIDRVIGLEIGADDYLPKPFNHRELIARVRAILRRSTISNHSQIDTKKYHDIEITPSRLEVLCQGQQIPLTSTEFSLLLRLLEKKGELVSKDLLSVMVLNKKLMPFDRSLDMHLSNLKKKLPPRADGRPRVKTIRGQGYIWLT